MTPERRTAIFERAIALQNVTIDHAIERGRDYLIERLTDCRRRIDEAGQLAVEVKRAIFEAKVARRAARGAQHLAPSVGNYKDEAAAADVYDELKALEESINVCRSTLRVADSDIRLAAVLLDAQLKVGAITPPPADTPATAPKVKSGDILSVSDLPERDDDDVDDLTEIVATPPGARTVTQTPPVVATWSVEETRLTEQMLRGRVHPDQPDNLAPQTPVDLASLINDASEPITRPMSATVESDEAISVEDLLR